MQPFQVVHDHDYLQGYPISMAEQNMLCQFKERGYLAAEYLWKQCTDLYLFTDCKTLPLGSFICNYLYFQRYNTTLFQFADPSFSKNDFFTLPIFWFRGKLNGFQIGDKVQGQYYIITNAKQRNQSHNFIGYMNKV